MSATGKDNRKSKGPAKAVNPQPDPLENQQSGSESATQNNSGAAAKHKANGGEYAPHPQEEAPPRSAFESATDALNRGWNPVLLDPRRKKPFLTAWQHNRYTADGLHVFEGDDWNVGAQMGPASGGLVDNDLDCPEAVAAAKYFMPPTDCVFGRKSARETHRLYQSDLCEIETSAVLFYKDPLLGGKEATMLELRVGSAALGAQTVIPESVHEDTGEIIRFEPGCDGAPAKAAGEALRQAAERIATAALLGRHYPSDRFVEAAAAVRAALLGAGLAQELPLFAGAIADAHIAATGDKAAGLEIERLIGAASEEATPGASTLDTTLDATFDPKVAAAVRG